MKPVSWFISKIGLKIKGSSHTEPFIIESAAHAHNLFVLQNSDGIEYDECAESEPEIKEVAKSKRKK